MGMRALGTSGWLVSASVSVQCCCPGLLSVVWLLLQGSDEEVVVIDGELVTAGAGRGRGRFRKRRKMRKVRRDCEVCSAGLSSGGTLCNRSMCPVALAVGLW